MLPPVGVDKLNTLLDLSDCLRQNVFISWVTIRLQTNRGYKKTNRNTDFLLLIFVSYSRIRIFKKGIRIRMKGIRIFKKPIPFIRNRIQKINRIIRIQTNRIIFIRIKRNSFGYKGIYSDIKKLSTLNGLIFCFPRY